MFQLYYLLNLLFTMAYTLGLLIYLGRYGAGHPKTRAFQRFLLALVAWSAFGALMSHVGAALEPGLAFSIFLWGSPAWLLVPPMAFEVMVALMRPVTWPLRALIFGPYLVLFLAILIWPQLISARQFGIPLGYPGNLSPFFLVYLAASVVMGVILLVGMTRNALRDVDRDAKKEKLILVVGGLASLVAIAAAEYTNDILATRVPDLGTLGMIPAALAAFWGIKRYGRVLSPRALYQTTVQAVPSGIAHVRGGHITWANQNLVDLLGLDSERQVVGRRVDEFLMPGMERGNLLAQLVDGEFSGQEVSLRHARYGQVPVLASGSLLDSQAPEQGTIVVLNDLSRLKEIQNKLERSELRYRNLVEQAMELIAVVQDRRCVFANAAATDVLGWEPWEMVGQSPEILFHPDDLHEIISLYHQAMAGRPLPGVTQLRLMTRTGQVVRAEVAARQVEWEGRPALQVIFRDVTDRYHALEALKQSEARYRAMFERMRSGVVVLETRDQGRDFVVSDINRAAAELEGVTRAEVLGVSLGLALPSLGLTSIVATVTRVWQIGEPEPLPPFLYSRGGEDGWREGFAYRLPSGEAVIIFDDVTDRRRAEEETLLREKLQAAIETAGAACHELNQPLQGVLMQAEVLDLKIPEDDPLKQGMAPLLEQINRMASITHRLNRITEYRTRHYLDNARILDLETGDDGAEEEEGPQGASARGN